MMIHTAMLLMVSLTLLIVSGCAIRAASHVGPVPIIRLAVDDDCVGASTLERDLSDGGEYRGDAQIYLNDQGLSCRYGR